MFLVLKRTVSLRNNLKGEKFNFNWTYEAFFENIVNHIQCPLTGIKLKGEKKHISTTLTKI